LALCEDLSYQFRVLLHINQFLSRCFENLEHSHAVQSVFG